MMKLLSSYEPTSVSHAHYCKKKKKESYVLLTYNPRVVIFSVGGPSRGRRSPHWINQGIDSGSISISFELFEQFFPGEVSIGRNQWHRRRKQSRIRHGNSYSHRKAWFCIRNHHVLIGHWHCFFSMLTWKSAFVFIIKKPIHKQRLNLSKEIIEYENVNYLEKGWKFWLKWSEKTEEKIQKKKKNFAV